MIRRRNRAQSEPQPGPQRHPDPAMDLQAIAAMRDKIATLAAALDANDLAFL
jgi:hypothetical protein